MKRREAPSSILAPLFIIFFLLPLSLPYVNWASQEGVGLTRGPHSSHNLPLFYFHRLFLSLSFSYLHFGLLFLNLPEYIYYICIYIYIFIYIYNSFIKFTHTFIPEILPFLQQYQSTLRFAMEIFLNIYIYIYIILGS